MHTNPLHPVYRSVSRSLKPLLILLFWAAAASCSPATLAAPTPAVPSVIPTQAATNTATLPPASPTPDLSGWQLSWSDEFNTPDGSGIDTTKWKVVTGGTGWGNAELEYYTDRLDNIYIENPTGQDGALVIKANEEKYSGLSYTSGRIKTQGLFDQAYGRFEARMQIPIGQGIWPAFWMMGSDGGWPNCGEIDIMENIGSEPLKIAATIHGPGYSGAQGVTTRYTSPDGTQFADAYHVYAIEWEPNVIRWYMDNQLYQTVTPADIPAGTQWVYDHPFYILLNLAVGGSWPQYPDNTTVFPQTFKIDYVRVYTSRSGYPTHTPTALPPATRTPEAVASATSDATAKP